MDKRLNDAIEYIRSCDIQPQGGLPENLFLMISGLVPLVNVDLLVTNSRGQLLLSRRNDRFFEKSWHIPGGCLRYGDSFAKRITETAERELRAKVSFDEQPLAVRNVWRGANASQEHPNERGQNIAILFACRLPEDYQIENFGKQEDEDGYLKWFDTLPVDFMKIQHVYDDCLKKWRIEG